MLAPLPGTWFSRAIPQSPGYARALARSWRCNCNGWKRYPSCETGDADSALKYAVVSGGLLLPTTVTDLIAAYRSSLASDPTNPGLVEPRAGSSQARGANLTLRTRWQNQNSSPQRGVCDSRQLTTSRRHDTNEFAFPPYIGENHRHRSASWASEIASGFDKGPEM